MCIKILIKYIKAISLRWYMGIICLLKDCLSGGSAESNIIRFFVGESIEQLINPKINLICFHNKTLLAISSFEHCLPAFLKDYKLPHHLPSSSQESH